MTRPRDRQSAMGLLPRMEARPWADGKTVTYRYRPIDGKPINLGTDKQEALRKVLDMLGERDTMGTLAWVWEQYQKSPRWAKYAQGTRTDYEGAWKQIDARLGHMHISTITPAIVSQYVHVERAESPRRADVEKSLLSRLFGHGIKLAVCEQNATVGVEPHGSEPRTRAVEPELLLRFGAWVSKQPAQQRIVGHMAQFAALTGNRRFEFLALTWPQVDRKAGIVRMVRAKQRGKRKGNVVEHVAITEPLAALLASLWAIREARGTGCLYVFPTKGNNAYSDRGFKTLWQRAMQAAMAAGVVPKDARFTFHDLRAFYVTQFKGEGGGLPELHADPGTTARVYDRSTVIKRRALKGA